MSKEFAEWLEQELDYRGWSRSEAARRGGVSPSMFDKVITYFSQPGLDFCRGVARAFAMELEDVLRKAGILPGSTDFPPQMRAWATRLASLGEEDRRAAAELMNQVLRFAEERSAGRSRRDPPSGP